MKSSVILFLYGTALFFVTRTYYRQGNTGMPSPTVLGPSSYLYGILGIVGGFTGSLTIPIAAGLTIALIWRTNSVDTTKPTPVVIAPKSGVIPWMTPNTPKKAG